MCKLVIKDRKIFCEEHGKFYSEEPIYRLRSGIYKIEIKNTNLFYIGLTNDFIERFTKHKYDLKRGEHGNFKLQIIVNNLGIGCLDFSIIEITKNYSLYNLECLYILKLKPKLNIFIPPENRIGWAKDFNVKMNPTFCQ